MELASRYTLEEKLGSGGMGEVWRAKDTGSGAEVAVKLQTELREDWALRFKREYLALRRLEHPGVVRVYELGESEGRGYYTMEYIAGQTLREHLVGGYWDGGTPTPFYYHQRDGMAAALRLIGQVVEILGYLHSEGLVHRDVKPANFLVRQTDRQVKVVDFGLVRQLGQDLLTTSGVIQGTPSYLAPEQIAGREIDARADLYALGVMLYELVTGELPFRDSEPYRVLQAHLNAFPAPPRSHNPRLSAGLEELILKLLAKQPQARPGSAAEVGRALEEATRDLEKGEDERSDTTTVTFARSEVALANDLLIAPWVGNPQGLAQSEEALARLLSRQGQLLLIAGASGQGKSRLMEETRASAVLRGVRCYLGGAREGPNLPYQVLRGVLEELQRDEPELIARHADALATALPGATPRRGADPKDEQARLYGACFDLFRELASQRSLCLLLDDLQWADEASLDLLTHLAYCFTGERPDAGQPMLLVGGYRSEEGDQGEAFRKWLAKLPQRLLHAVRLQPLTRDETGQLMQYLLGQSHLPHPAFVERIHAATGGACFNIVETLRALIAEGKLYRKHDKEDPWEVPGLAEVSRVTGFYEELPVPESVRAAVERRLARHSEEDVKALRVAALIGKKVPFALWQKTVGIGEETLLEIAERFLRERWLVEGGGDILELLHDQLRAAVLAGMTGVARRLWQGRIASAMRALHPEIPDALAGEYASHLEGAGQVDAALPHYAQAARVAQRGYQNDEALALWAKLLELAEERPVFAELVTEAHGSRGDILGHLARFSEALEELDKAIARCTPDSPEQLHWRVRKMCALQGHPLDQWQVFGETAIAACRRAGMLVEEAKASCYLSTSLLDAGRVSVIESLARDLIPRAEVSDDPLALAYALQVLCSALWAHGSSERAAELQEQILVLQGRLGNVTSEIAARMRLADLLGARGETGAAEVMYRRGMEEALRTGHRLNVVVSTQNLALTLLEASRVEEAERLAGQALDLALEVGSGSGIGFSYELLGCIHRDQGKLSSAIELLQEAIECHQVTGAASLPNTLCDLGLTLVLAGETERGLEAIAEGLKGAVASEIPAVQTEALIQASRAYEAVGEREQAIRLITQASEVAENASRLVDLRRAREILTRLKAAGGSPTGAVQ